MSFHFNTDRKGRGLCACVCTYTYTDVSRSLHTRVPEWSPPGNRTEVGRPSSPASAGATFVRQSLGAPESKLSWKETVAGPALLQRTCSLCGLGLPVGVGVEVGMGGSGPAGQTGDNPGDRSNVRGVWGTPISTDGQGQFLQRFVTSCLLRRGTAVSIYLFLIRGLETQSRTFLEKQLNLVTFPTGREHSFVCGIHPLNTKRTEAEPKPQYAEWAPAAGTGE